MASDHDPSALDAPIPAGGVPRHASAKERRGLKPFLSDLKAEVQNQLSRAEIPGRVPQAAQATAVDLTARQAAAAPAAREAATTSGTAYEPSPQQPDNATALASAALATADHAGAEAAAARDEAADARADAAAARSEAAAAQATAARADAQLAALRAEIEAAHREFESLRTQLDDAGARTRRQVLVAWAGAGVAAVLAVVALVLGL
ncbi:hypothetical protein [Promicromonospora sp. MEB111]|uniref:hypothetical protein n=1 Tax=Promicromonospora sp. MEB111 TaxID=3040301 RepID=UPI002550A9A1|nr:hypothetical protein [Promicromonospora sp. MEB111]